MCPEPNLTGWVAVFGSTGGVRCSFVAESALDFLLISEKSNVGGFENGKFSLASTNFDNLKMSNSIKTGHF